MFYCRLFGILFLLGLQFEAVSVVDRPNVLLIITDDQNIDTVGCYGGAVQTPHIDSLAENGIRFVNGNVVHTICSPSRYAILTGRYYDNSYAREYNEQYPHGTPSCINNDMTIEPDGNDMASVLHANGYCTAYIGKYHLTDHQLLHLPTHWQEYGLQTYPEDADPRIDKETNAKMKANHKWWCSRMKELGYDHVDAFYPANLREGFNTFINAHNVEWTADAAIRFLNSRKSETQPFYMVLGTTYPHGPAPERKIDGNYDYSLDADVKLTGEGYVTDRNLSRVLAGESRESVKRLDGETDLDMRASTACWWDASVGAVLKALKDIGQYENTLVIYISDHGQQNSGKSTIYENGCHVPLLMQWPAAIAAGRTYRHVVGSIDLVPTVFDACGVKVPEDYPMDGVSLLPVLKGDEIPVRESLFLQMGFAHGVKTDDWKYIAVRYPKVIEEKIQRGEREMSWKAPNESVPPGQPYLIKHQQLARWSYEKNPHYFERNQLYHLADDPAEQDNLFFDLPEKSALMKRMLDISMQEIIPHRPFGEFGNGGDKEFYHEIGEAMIVQAPLSEAEAEASSRPSCNISVPQELKPGVPFRAEFTFFNLPQGCQAGSSINGLDANGQFVKKLLIFEPLEGIENNHLYLVSGTVDSIPSNVTHVSFGVNASVSGKWEDRLVHELSSPASVIR